MKIILLLTLALVGQDKPAQQAGEMKDLKTCEAEAHRFLTHKFPAEIESRVIMKSAACGFIAPGNPT